MKQKKVIMQNGECGIISAYNNQVPIIGMKSSYINNVIAAINFLRCGCPAVQLVDTVERTGHQLHSEWMSELKLALTTAQLPEEEFIVIEEYPIVTIKLVRK